LARNPDYQAVAHHYHTYRGPVSCLTAALLALAVALVLSAPALGATQTDNSQFAVTAGTLAFGTAPDAPNLPGLTLNGQAQTLLGTMNNFSVNDASGAAAGWNVTVNGDTGGGKSAVFAQYCPVASCGGGHTGPGYVGSGFTLAANSLTLSSTGAGFSALNGTTGTPPTHSCAAGCFVDAASPVKVISAASGAGMGTYQATYAASNLSFSAPSTIKALQTSEVYRIDLLWTLSSGP
jgi:hypothetical protein